MSDRIWATDASGSLEMSPDQQNDAYQRLGATEALLNDAQEEVDILEQRLANESMEQFVSARELDALVEGFLDPKSSRFRDTLVRGVRDLAFVTESSNHRGLIGTRLSWSGKFVFDSALGRHAVDFAGSVLLGAALTTPSRSLRVLREMRHRGTPVWTADCWPSTDRGLVADLLGVDTRHFAVGSCPDPDLVRLWMAIAYPEPAEGEAASEVPRIEALVTEPHLHARFGDLDALVAHMRAMCEAGTQRWRFRRSLIETEEIIKAVARQEAEADNAARVDIDNPVDDRQAYRTRKLRGAVRGTARAERWAPLLEKQWPRFAPCHWCSAPLAAVAEFDEAQGYICLNCRRDDAGVRWDHDFDKWIAFSDVWAQSGVVLPGQDGQA